MRYVLIILILYVFRSISFSGEILVFEASNDTAYVEMNDLSKENIIKKEYFFKFAPNGFIEFHDILWKLKNDYKIFSEVDPNKIYFMESCGGVIASSFVFCYFNKNFLNVSMPTMNARMLTPGSLTKPEIALYKMYVTLKDINVSGSDTLYRIEIDDNTDIFKEFVYDQNLNLILIKHINDASGKEYIYRKKE